MRPFCGSEPLVGEIAGLRTFRVDETGPLLPLYSNLAWYDGPNTATCAPPTGEDGGNHTVSAGCECGFYAYGSVAAAEQNRATRYVQAVVSCWGEVVAGTHGVRAQHARIDALWLHPNISAHLRRRVAATYPSAALYADRDAMLAEHPLTVLDCYEPPPAPRVLPRVAAVAGTAALLALGLVPGDLLRASTALWDVWLLAAGGVAFVAAWLLVGVHSVGHRAAAFVVGGVLAWLIAPMFGLSGWLLRAPVLRGLLVVGGGYLRQLRPGYFPIVHTPRARAFCGVRP